MANVDAKHDTELRSGALVTPTLRLVRALGAGGMGRVWIAEHLGLRTQVVVKFVAEELAANADALARFSREAAAASQVKSPHVVHMIDHGVATNGAPFIAMELLEGIDLRARLTERHTLPPQEVVAIIAQAARALAAAHQRGIVHRDIKPENIFLTDAGSGELFVKVLDFGIAKSMGADSSFATGTGAMVGTPLYMSPEQILGHKTLDFRADLWSLGVVAFEALTGDLPFTGETVGAVSVAICSGETPLPSQRNPLLGNAVDAWFGRACARDLAQRFGSAKEQADALATAISSAEDEPTRVLSGLMRPTPTTPAQTGPGLPPTRVSGAPFVARTAPPTVGMLTTGGAASSVADSEPTTTRMKPRRLLVWGAVAGVVGALVGLVLFALTRGPAATTANEDTVPSRAAAASSSSPRPDASSRATERPELTAPVEVAPTAAPSAPAVTPSAKVTVPRPTQVPGTSSAAATVSTPPKSTATPTPVPTRRKASDVVLE